MASAPLTSHFIRTHVDAFLLAVASSTDNFMVGISVGLSTLSLTTSSVVTTTSTTKSTSTSTSARGFANFTKVNLVVALCNASGTLLASWGGESLRLLPQHALQRLAAAVSSSASPETYIVNYSIESFLAALAFAYLAWKEYSDNDDDNKNNHGDDTDDHDKKRKKSRNDSNSISYSIALPMTLNNLAGGVAGGVLGLSVMQATFYAFVVSFGSMALGYSLAGGLVAIQERRHLNNKTPSSASLHENKKMGSSHQTLWWSKYMAMCIYLLLCLQSLLQV